MLLESYTGHFILPCSHKIANLLVKSLLLADAVGQSLSTRPDIIGSEISKVS